MVKALGYCFSEGFGGGHNQLPHLAPTYAEFLAAVELGAFELLEDRQAYYSFFKKMKKGGRFTMHEEG
jgi:protein farnesyltransferase subunit beta